MLETLPPEILQFISSYLLLDPRQYDRLRATSKIIRNRLMPLRYLWNQIPIKDHEWIWINRVVAFLENLSKSALIQTPSMIVNGIHGPRGCTNYIHGTLTHDTKCTKNSFGNQICHIYREHPCGCYHFMGKTGYYFPLNAENLNDHLYLGKNGKIQSRTTGKRHSYDCCYCNTRRICKDDNKRKKI